MYKYGNLIYDKSIAQINENMTVSVRVQARDRHHTVI